MPEDKKLDVWDVQEWVRTAPLKIVAEHIIWARAIVEMREQYEAGPKRKQRSDAGKKRDDGQQPIDLREIAK